MSGDERLKFSARNELDELGKYGRSGHGLEILGVRKLVFVNPF
jgi:hypothetical protein